MTKDDFLERLVGSWSLSGTAGSRALRQKVESVWVIEGRYVRMHFIEQEPIPHDRPRYEAIYMIGRDDKNDEYVLHLFDTFGATYSRVLGVGKRDVNAITFLFHYPDGLFSNRFTWDPRTREWRMLLKQQEGAEGWKVFAEKTLTRQ